MALIFGPVHSRRFGVSLGIDLSPSLKQCNFDCLYCELAPAETMDTQIRVVAVSEVISELNAALLEHPNVDVITVTANGEPTLYPHLEELVKAIKRLELQAELLILTNSATLTNSKTYTTLLKFDQVKLSLDAVSADVFKKIDRPHEGISAHNIALHVKRFSQEYQGKLFIEILFVAGLNDTDDEISKLNAALLHVKAERIDIGTVDRPPAYAVEALSYLQLLEISKKFDASLPIHIASRHGAEILPSTYSKDEIINTLDKRPLSESDIELLFDAPSKALLQMLVEDNTISKIERSNIVFYLLSQNLKRKRQKS